MPKINKTKNNPNPLKQFYDNAVNFSKSIIMDSKLIQEKYGVSVYGASCLLYMLNRKEYCPELEEIYTQIEVNPLVGKDEKTYRMIKFIEDMPPFKHYQTCYNDDISVVDMEKYVSIGLANWVSFEDFRQETIHLYVEFSRITKQHNIDMREAITNKDREFLKYFFGDNDKKKIEEYMIKHKYNKRDTETVIKLLS